MNSTSFQPHINGLRAIAIGGVLLYHLNSQYCPAGYFGVDIFLVISGYFLLCSLTNPKVGKENFRYGNYLVKKAWRIYPPMIVISALTCMAVQILNPEMLADSLKITFINCFGGSDYYIDHMGGYFDTTSQYNPHLHFWYLAITLQLYVMIPLLVVPMARRNSHKVLITTLSTLVVVSLGFHILTSAPIIPWEIRTPLLHALGMNSAYYHLVPRLWEFFAGYFILFLPEGYKSPRIRSALALAGIILCALPFFLFPKGSAFVYTTVIGAMLLIRYGSAGVVGKILDNRLVQWLGTLSFSLYLVHWPVMVLWKYILIYKPSLGAEIGMLLLSLVSGYVVWRWVERLRPDSFKSVRNSGLYRTLQYGLLCLPLLTACYYVSYKIYRVYCPIPIKKTVDSRQFPLVLKGFPKENFAFPPCPIGDNQAQEPTFLLLGDSHARHLYHGLNIICAREKILGVYLNNSCTPYKGYFLPCLSSGAASWDTTQAEGLLTYLHSQPNIRYVLIAQCWADRLEERNGFREDTMEAIQTKEEATAFLSQGLRETCDRITALGKKIILLADVPKFANPSPSDEYKRCKRFGWKPPIRHVTQEQHKNRNAKASKLMQELLGEGRISAVIDLAPALLREGAYPAQAAGEFLYVDTNHLSEKGSMIVANYLRPLLKTLR